MTKRELLELAAKAAGLSLSHCDDSVWDDERADYVGWNPITDDGDAFRLMVQLRIDIAHFVDGVRADVTGYDDCYQPNDDDPLAATRRAIVRAAAEIGRGMK